jgi:hypothetical protein
VTPLDLAALRAAIAVGQRFEYRNPRAGDPMTWRVSNLLGFALVRARAVLRGELPRQIIGYNLPG